MQTHYSSQQDNVNLTGKTVPAGEPPSFLPARRYASAVFATATCLSVRPSVCHTLVLCLAERKQDREMYAV